MTETRESFFLVDSRVEGRNGLVGPFLESEDVVSFVGIVACVCVCVCVCIVFSQCAPLNKQTPFALVFVAVRRV